MKKTKLILRRESITQLSETRLGGVKGGIQTDSNTCTGQTNGCPVPTTTSIDCSNSVSTVVRLTQHYGC